MTKTRRTQNRAAAPSPVPGDMLAFNRESADAYGRAWAAYLQAWGQCGRELADFSADRLRKDTELGASLSRCRSWTETAEVQGEWVRATLDDYARETGRLMEIWSAVAEAPVAREAGVDAGPGTGSRG